MKRVISIFLTLFFAVAILCSCGSSKFVNIPIINLSSDDFERTLFADDSDELVILLDVRTPEEFAQGHIKGAINVNVRDDNFLKEAKAALKIKEGRVLPTVAIYCRSGVRSLRAAELLEKKGYAKKVYNLESGMIGWMGEVVR